MEEDNSGIRGHAIILFGHSIIACSLLQLWALLQWDCSNYVAHINGGHVDTGLDSFTGGGQELTFIEVVKRHTGGKRRMVGGGGTLVNSLLLNFP